MSFYATIAGSIMYARQADFEAALNVIQGEDGWLDQEDHFVDEAGDRVTEEQPIVDRTNRLIELPNSHYRNLTRTLDKLFVGGTGKVVWTSTDGCLSAGVIVDSHETAYDLAAWNLANGGSPAPDELPIDAYLDWQEEVQEAFFDEFGK